MGQRVSANISDGAVPAAYICRVICTWRKCNNKWSNSVRCGTGFADGMDGGCYGIRVGCVKGFFVGVCLQSPTRRRMSLAGDRSTQDTHTGMSGLYRHNHHTAVGGLGKLSALHKTKANTGIYVRHVLTHLRALRLFSDVSESKEVRGSHIT